RGWEGRRLRVPLTAQGSEVDLDAADAARLGERDSLWLQSLRGEDAAAGVLRGIGADEAEVARQLLDGLDRRDALDLDRHPLAVVVAAHQVDRADLGRPFALDEGELLAERRRRG